MGSSKSFIKLEANKCTNVVKMEVLLQCNRVFFVCFFFRIQVLKLWCFSYMHTECQAYEQLPDWKKQFPVDVTGYDEVLRGKEQHREAYKERLASQATNFKTLDQIESAIAEHKEAVELHRQQQELASVELRNKTEYSGHNQELASMELRNETEYSGQNQEDFHDFMPVEYTIFDVEHSSVNEAGLVVTQESSANVTDAHSDPKFMEFDLSDLFRTIPTCGTDGSDSAISHLSVGGEHSYSKLMNMQSVELNEIGSNEHSYTKLGKNPKGNKQNKMQEQAHVCAYFHI